MLSLRIYYNHTQKLYSMSWTPRIARLTLFRADGYNVD